MNAEMDISKNQWRSTVGGSQWTKMVNLIWRFFLEKYLFTIDRDFPYLFFLKSSYFVKSLNWKIVTYATISTKIFFLLYKKRLYNLLKTENSTCPLNTKPVFSSWSNGYKAHWSILEKNDSKTVLIWKQIKMTQILDQALSSLIFHSIPLVSNFSWNSSKN